MVSSTISLPLDGHHARQMADLFSVLANPHRLEILALLCVTAPLSRQQIAAAIGRHPRNVWGDLAALREMELVQVKEPMFFSLPEKMNEVWRSLFGITTYSKTLSCPVTRQKVQAIAQIFRVINHPLRLGILALLDHHGSLSRAALQQAFHWLRLPAPTLDSHIQMLVKHNFLQAKCERGLCKRNIVLYRLSSPDWWFLIRTIAALVSTFPVTKPKKRAQDDTRIHQINCPSTKKWTEA